MSNITPLYDAVAEQAVLGSILLSPQEAYPIVAPLLKPADFYEHRHQWIYEAMRQAGDYADPISVYMQLDKMVIDERKGTKASAEVNEGYLFELRDVVATSLGVSMYARTVRDWSKRRELVKACQRIVQKAYDLDADIAGVTESAYLEVEKALTASDDQQPTLSQIVNDYLALRELEIAGDIDALGIKTGFLDIDKMMGGLVPGELFTIAGPTGGGKTTLMLQMLLNAVQAGKRGAAFIMEMSDKQVVRKLVASMAKVNTSRAVAKTMPTDAFAKEMNAAQALTKLPLELRYYPGATLAQIAAECQRLKARGGLDMVVVDYLQIMSTESGRGVSRAQALGEITRGLKNMAGKLNLVVLLGSQMNREGMNGNPAPQLEHLKESGSIEQDSSRVGMLHLPNPDVKTGVYFYLRKNREGETGNCPLFFQREFSRFVDAERVQL